MVRIERNFDIYTMFLFLGAVAYAVSAVVGHYPWFSVYNYLSKNETMQRLIPKLLFRNAAIGMIASFVSDTVVNSIRVIKTTKQAMGARHAVTYGEVISMVVAADGWKVGNIKSCFVQSVCWAVYFSIIHLLSFAQGLFGRGLRTRLFSNAIQSIMFTVIWRGLAETWSRPRMLKSSEDDSEAEEIYEEAQMD